MTACKGGNIINRKCNLRTIYLIWICIIFVGCNTSGNEPTPLPPTATPAPLTDVRLASTDVPAGLPGNPLQMVIQPISASLYVEPEVTQEPDGVEVLLPVSSTQAELELEKAILNVSSVTVDVVPVASASEALEALCDETETISAVWIDGVSLSVALAQNCGEPIFVVEKQIGDELQIGESGVIILNRAIGNLQLSVLNSRTFCRLGVDDFYSWLLPLMIFRANNINPANFEAIVDYEDVQELVEAVASGDCAGAGVSGMVYNSIVDEDEPLSDDVSVAFGSPPIPFAVLMYPVEMQLGIRVSLTEGMQVLVENEEDNQILQAFLGQDNLRVYDTEDFEEYNAFLEEVGLDFTILGE